MLGIPPKGLLKGAVLGGVGKALGKAVAKGAVKAGATGAVGKALGKAALQAKQKFNAVPLRDQPSVKILNK